MSLWTPGRRKVTASLVAFVAVTGYAVHKGASFAEYASCIEWLLGSFLFAHAGQQIGTRSPKP